MSVDKTGGAGGSNFVPAAEDFGEFKATGDNSVGGGLFGAGGAGGFSGFVDLVGKEIPLSFKQMQENAQNLDPNETGLDNGISPEITEEMKQAFEKLLSSIGGSSDELAALLIKFANMGRQNALDQRLQARDAAKSDLEAQADNTREAALKNMIAGIAMAVVAVVAAVVSVFGAVKSVGQAKGAANMNKDANAMGKDAAQMSKISDRAQGSTAAAKLKTDAGTKSDAADSLKLDAKTMETKAVASGTKYGAISGAVSAVGQAVQKGIEFDAANQTAEGQELAAEAQVEQSNSDLAKKVMDDLEELVKSTIRFLKEMQTAETDLMANMTRV